MGFRKIFVAVVLLTTVAVSAQMLAGDSSVSVKDNSVFVIKPEGETTDLGEESSVLDKMVDEETTAWYRSQIMYDLMLYAQTLGLNSWWIGDT